MGASPSQGSWPQVRRSLFIGVLLVGAMSVFSLVRGRPGDVEIGLIGFLIGGLLAAGVGAVEVVGRRIVRRARKDDSRV